MRRTVVMFAKAPVPGQVKTRLAASVGAEKAAAFHAAFIADLCAMLGAMPVKRVLAWSGDVEHPGFDPARIQGFELIRQPQGDLGTRMDQVLRTLAADADAVVVIGSDSPTLQPEHIEDAFVRLESHDVVLGPSFDGGYYLIGVKSQWYRQHAPEAELHPLFDGVSWSTVTVLDQTLRRAAELGALCDLTAFCYDVDTIEDLNLMETHLLRHLRPSGLDVAPNTAILLSNTPES